VGPVAHSLALAGTFLSAPASLYLAVHFVSR
jgi:hypothetical protein